MEKKDLVEGMRLYIYKLRMDGRYSTAKSYQDALNSFMRFCGLEVIPYIYVNKENLRRYQAFLLNKGCTVEHGVDLYASDPLCVQHGGGGRLGPLYPLFI